MAIFLSVIIGLLAAWLDIFFTASFPGSLKISFLVLGMVAYLVKNRPAGAWGVVLSSALAAELMAPLPWFGLRLLGYVLFFLFCRFLIESFFPINRPAAVWALVFILSLTIKISALLYNLTAYWWSGAGALSLFSLRGLGVILISSVLTAAAMAGVNYIFSKFNLITRRWFLIRH